MYTEWVKLDTGQSDCWESCDKHRSKRNEGDNAFPNPGSSSITIDNLPATAKEYKLTLRDTRKTNCSKVLTATDHKRCSTSLRFPTGYFLWAFWKGVKLKAESLLSIRFAKQIESWSVRLLQSRLTPCPAKFDNEIPNSRTFESSPMDVCKQCLGCFQDGFEIAYRFGKHLVARAEPEVVYLIFNVTVRPLML